MSGIRPRGSVGAAWQTSREAKTGEKEETAFSKAKVKANSIGDAMPAVNNKVKSRDGCELKKKRIRWICPRDSSIEAMKSTSKRMAAADAKEKEELVPPVFPPMDMDPFTFQWVTWRRETDRKLGIFIDSDEQNNFVQVAGISEISLTGEKNRSSQAMPDVCS